MTRVPGRGGAALLLRTDDDQSSDVDQGLPHNPTNGWDDGGWTAAAAAMKLSVAAWHSGSRTRPANGGVDGS